MFGLRLDKVLHSGIRYGPGGEALKKTVAIRVNIGKALHKAVRLRALEDEVTLEVFVSDALKAYVAQRRRPVDKVLGDQKGEVQ